MILGKFYFFSAELLKPQSHRTAQDIYLITLIVKVKFPLDLKPSKFQDISQTITYCCLAGMGNRERPGRVGADEFNHDPFAFS